MRHMRLLAHALQVLGTLLNQGPVWFQDAWSVPEILKQVILLVCGLPDSLAIVCTLTCLIHGAVTAGLSYCPAQGKHARHCRMASGLNCLAWCRLGGGWTILSPTGTSHLSSPATLLGQSPAARRP